MIIWIVIWIYTYNIIYIYGTLWYTTLWFIPKIEDNRSKPIEMVWRFYRDPDKATGSWRGWSPAYAPSAGPSIMALSPRGKKQHKNQLEPTSKNIAYVSMSNCLTHECNCAYMMYVVNYQYISKIRMSCCHHSLALPCSQEKKSFLGGPIATHGFVLMKIEEQTCVKKRGRMKGRGK